MKNIIVLISIFFLAVACHKPAPESPLAIPDKIPVQVIPIQRDTVSPEFEAVGYFTTEDETVLSFKNGGIIEKLYVREGDAIHKGQLLATVRADEVNTGLSQAETAYHKAERDYERAVVLHRDSVATLEQMQNAETALKLARESLELARSNTGYSGIYALENGYVLERYLNEGQLAGPGIPVLLVNGARQGQWHFQVSLSEAQWAAVHVGDPAEITTDVAPQKTLQARVIRKGRRINPETGGMNVLLSVLHSGEIPLASGVFGEATIRPDRGQAIWSVPYEALLDGDAEYGYVFVTHDLEIARKIQVHISGLSADQVRIDQGLDSIPYLIVSGSAYLNDGSAISLNHQKD